MAPSARTEPLIRQHITHEAQRRFVESGRYGAVVGVGFGRRTRDQLAQSELVLTVFVRHKGRLKKKQRLPEFLHTTFAGTTYSVPVDVVELAPKSSRFHSAVEPCSPVALKPNAAARGCVSWVLPGAQTQHFVTAEHVVGFVDGATPVFAAGGLRIGTVVKRAFAGKKLDAALVEAAADVTLQPSIPGQMTLGDVRYTSTDDISNGAPSARAYLPVSQQLVDVTVRLVHVLGSFDLIDENGVRRFPQSLILTDPVTVEGDSGATLFGSDWCPIGLCTGQVKTSAGKVFDAFTELGPALDALGVDWNP